MRAPDSTLGDSERESAIQPFFSTSPNEQTRCHASEVSRQIEEDAANFQMVVAQSDAHLRRKQHRAAAVYAEIAASQAFCKHPGQFASPNLERILMTIGRTVLPPNEPFGPRSSSSARVTRVLHVLTRVAAIGGHSRMAWRWIEQDAGRSHSVVLTRQGVTPVPGLLVDAVAARQGTIEVLNRRAGNVVTWAARLRRIAASADVVILHVDTDDAIPMLAFADKRGTPPVAFVDHADHAFWLGASISDVIVNLRTTGACLAQDRRGIDRERTAVLPITLNSTMRAMSQAEAKRRLGLPEDSIVLLSIARTPKFRSINGAHFADAFLPILERFERTVLLAVGAQHDETWERVAARVGGRVRAVGPRTDTDVFYQAADIYVDSYPAVSITSLLEAASYGVPLVSRCPVVGDCTVLCADAPGLDNHLVRVQSGEALVAELSRLIEDKAYRLELGDKTRRDVVEAHVGAGWQGALERTYHQLLSVQPVTPNAASVDTRLMEGVDLAWSPIFRIEIELRQMLRYRAQALPLDLRFQLWRNLLHDRQGVQLKLLLPEWTSIYARRLLSTVSRHR